MTTQSQELTTDPAIWRLFTIRRGLILKIDTGMNLTRFSALTVAQKDGLTDAKQYRKALRDVNGFFILNGQEAQWSKKYPADKPTTWTTDADGYATRLD